jgi:4-diphosphocytidyl-2-C-methyl-D-erythritol kinase
MVPITLCDRITISAAEQGIAFTCDDTTLPTGDGNLAVQAAKLFFTSTGLPPAVHIHLDKKIPHGAGLGGGSSDAATVLLGLNQWFETALPPQRLYDLAARIGSDVAFFIAGSAARCRGRGELIEPVAVNGALSILLLKPAFGIPTPWAYSRWHGAVGLPDVCYELQEFGGHEFMNDLERPVFEKYPFLAQAKRWLISQPEVGAAMMSGSGSTMFAVLRAPGAAVTLAERARAELDPELWTCACETRHITH